MTILDELNEKKLKLQVELQANYKDSVKRKKIMDKIHAIDIEYEKNRKENFNTIIKVENISKIYGNKVNALSDINLEIYEGEVFGLLGRNGAGKTTLISILSTELKQTSGIVKIDDLYTTNFLRSDGVRIEGERDEVRRRIGIIFQNNSLDDELTARENLNFHGRSYHIPQPERAKRINEVLKMVELEYVADKPVKSFSGGMKRRLEIARSIIHDPLVLFLDEPTLGLDVQTRIKLWKYIKALRTIYKRAIVLTSHYMEEVEALCDRIAIIENGKIITIGTVEELKLIYGEKMNKINPSLEEIFLFITNETDSIDKSSMAEKFKNFELN